MKKKGIHCQMQLYFVCVCVGMFTGTIIMNVKSFDMTAMHMAFTRDYGYKYISPSFLSIEKRKKIIGFNCVKRRYLSHVRYFICRNKFHSSVQFFRGNSNALDQNFVGTNWPLLLITIDM